MERQQRNADKASRNARKRRAVWRRRQNDQPSSARRAAAGHPYPSGRSTYGSGGSAPSFVAGLARAINSGATRLVGSPRGTGRNARARK